MNQVHTGGMTTIDPDSLSGRFDNSAFFAYCEALKRQYPGNNKILFVQIPQVILDSFNRDIALHRGYYAFPPTGLQCLYESIKTRGFDIKILDLNYELLARVFADQSFDPNDWPIILDEMLESWDPGIVAVSCLFDMGIGPLLEVLRRVRQRGRAILIAGGVIATYETSSLLSETLSHFVVQGEGENKINFLLDHLTEDLGSTPTPGIRFNDGKLRQTEGPPDHVVSSGTLIDSYRLVPIEKYCLVGSLNPFSRSQAPEPFAPIQFCRGCRAQCTFCSVRDFMGKEVRCRPVADVLAEMEYLYEQRGVRHFEWLDDDLLFYRNEIKQLLRTIIAKGWDIHWSANNGLIAASIDEEMLELIQASGCVGFKIGIETGNEEMLRVVKKPGKHSKFLSFAAMLPRYPEPFVGGNFIVGLPHETVFQLMDTFRFALEVDLDWAAFTVCQAIRGASAFSEAGEYFEHQMKSAGGLHNNFIPTRHNSQGRLTVDASLARNLDLFRLPADLVPSKEQINEVWFTFNVLVNYVHNKNLRPGGRPDKFIRWIETVRRAYPNNPYMLLFLALAEILNGEPAIAREHAEQALAHSGGDYWQDRFTHFHLDALVANFPTDADGVFTALADVRERLLPSYSDWLTAGRGNIPATAA
jgi:tRNA A37 methylthiotransferase MiaB